MGRQHAGLFGTGIAWWRLSVFEALVYGKLSLPWRKGEEMKKVSWVLAGSALLSLAACAGRDVSEMNSVEYSEQVVQVEMPANVESQHPYSNNTERWWTLEAPEVATSLILPFDQLQTEWGYDYVVVYDGQDNIVSVLTGDASGASVTVSGNKAQILLLTDESVTDFGVSMMYYYFTKPAHDYTDHRPVCLNIGTDTEGWYWADTGANIKTANCGPMGEARCVGIGSRSEGWASDSGLITWDSGCHHTMRISLAGEPCGPSIGFSCFDDLYCQGLPGDGVIGGSGTCMVNGTCETDADCYDEKNEYPKLECEGRYLACEDGRCISHCDFFTDFEDDTPLEIPDNDPEGIHKSLMVHDLPHCMLQAHLSLDITHSYIGDLVVSLVEPGGEEMMIHNGEGGNTDDLHIDDIIFDKDFTKEGNWSLNVRDTAWLDTGTVNLWALHFTCL